MSLPRRDFLLTAWRGMAALAGGGAAFIGLRFLASRQGGGVFGGVVAAGTLDGFPPGSVTPFPDSGFYLVRLPDGGLLALYRKCPHLDCVVLWNARDEQFNCPCHGSLFAPSGENLKPPANRPLLRFAVILEGALVRVDTGDLIERSAISPADVVYPPENAT